MSEKSVIFFINSCFFYIKAMGFRNFYSISG